MKRIIVVFALCAPLFAFAQDSLKEHGIRELSLGVMLSSLTTHAFGDKTPFVMSWTFSPTLSLVTGATEHRLMLDIGNDALGTINGVRLPRHWNAYTVLNKSLQGKDAYGAIGIEKSKEIVEEFEFVFFLEAGTDFLGKQSVTLGLFALPGFSLLKERHEKK